MNRRNLPQIDPADLRDHATAETVDRVWGRIEADLGVARVARAGARRWTVLLSAAAVVVVAFSGGVLSGRLAWQRAELPEQAQVERASDERPLLDVLAAGTQARTFELPGGGHITLSPGGTVEIVRNADGSLSLMLVQGEARVDAEGVTHALAVFAGEAMLSIPGGSALRVRRAADDTMDVSVSDGTVHMVAPSGSRSLRRGERADAIPIHAAVSQVAPLPPLRTHPPAPLPPRERSAAEPGKVLATGPDWVAQSNAGNITEALRILRGHADGIRGAILAARSAQELMDIHDVVTSSPEPAEKALAVEALRRIVESFPDSQYAQIAAFKLGQAYQHSNPAESRRWFEKAQSFAGPLSEDALCRRFRAARGEEASRLAADYLQRYPEGRCKDDAERVAAGDDGAAEEEPLAADGGLDAG
jgi:hypothetical protein